MRARRARRRALELLGELRASGLEPSAISFNAAISACEKGGEWERALALVDEMRARGPAPNAISFNAAISACMKGGARAEATALYADAASRDLLPRLDAGGKIDLHDLPAAVACVAVASSLEHLARGEVALPDDDLMIVTGQGKHKIDAAIKPQIEEMLAAPEFAMLSLTQYAKNPGRLLVPAENLGSGCDAASASAGGRTTTVWVCGCLAEATAVGNQVVTVRPRVNPHAAYQRRWWRRLRGEDRGGFVGGAVAAGTPRTLAAMAFLVVCAVAASASPLPTARCSRRPRPRRSAAARSDAPGWMSRTIAMTTAAPALAAARSPTAAATRAAARGARPRSLARRPPRPRRGRGVVPGPARARRRAGRAARHSRSPRARPRRPRPPRRARRRRPESRRARAVRDAARRARAGGEVAPRRGPRRSAA